MTCRYVADVRLVEASVTEAGTKQEWLAGADRLSSQPIRPGQTVGAEKNYDVGAFIAACRELGFTPHVASKARYSHLDRRTTRHAGYQVSQKKRKRVEEPFGWMKTYGLLAKLRHRGRKNKDPLPELLFNRPLVSCIWFRAVLEGKPSHLVRKANRAACVLERSKTQLAPLAFELFIESYRIHTRARDHCF